MFKEEEKVLPMIGGNGKTSYAANSRHQEKAIMECKLLVEEAVKDVCAKTQTDTFVVADLGCSSGPNTFSLLSMIMHAIGAHCHPLGQKPPELQCLLNDLPGNDFNTLFLNLDFLKMKIEQEKKETASVPNYYVMGAPGDFYGRLFPSNSVHFFHSSYCLHWRSKVPDGVKSKDGVPLNKRNIYIAKTSTPNVIKSYYELFKSDFSSFLDLRYKELVRGGKMVLTFLGRKSKDARNGESSCLFSLLADALNSMVQQGLLQEDKVAKFNFPCYMPSIEEVKEEIIKHRLFSIHQLYATMSNWDPNDESVDHHESFDSVESGKNVAKSLRPVFEPTLARHFGHTIMDELFARMALNVGNHLLKQKGKYAIIVVSLVK